MLKWLVYQEYIDSPTGRELSAAFMLKHDAQFYADTMNKLYKDGYSDSLGTHRVIFTVVDAHCNVSALIG